MRLYEQKKWWKRALVLIAICIGVFSIWYTNKLVKQLAIEEQKKIKLWANATQSMAKAEGDIDFLLDIVTGNETIPIILTDGNNKIISYRNIDSTLANDTAFLNEELLEMKSQHNPIKIVYDEENNFYQLLYYKNSIILTQLKAYPAIQLALISFFAIMSYLALSSSRRSEQNQVWVGMSKETAHQLGTPISSLSEWINLLRETPKEEQGYLLDELQNDTKRLELITERFSKIGSEPVLKEENMDLVIENSMQYLKTRVSSQVNIHINVSTPGNWAKINIPLFDWVLENVCKNAIDAMEGKGELNINIGHDLKHVLIDIKDSGKGIPKSKFKTVFKPGFTTKKRGWGLGLSLVKRIVEGYHKGKIFVRQSELGKGTTFRIILNKV
ncbi:MAG: HAMP domain-containing sensor histidine kinase [Bacteroidota bacterium]|jgi:signal transduction histidine kinase